MFDEYAGEEKISVKELTKIFQRPLLKMRAQDAEDMARYLIEPRDQPTIAYNKYVDKPMVEARIKFDSFLNAGHMREFQQKIPEFKKDLMLVYF